MPHWSAEDLDAKGIPNVGSELCHSTRHSPAQFQIRVFPMCNVPSTSSPEDHRSHAFARVTMEHEYRRGMRINTRHFPTIAAPPRGCWIPKLNNDGMRGSPCSPPSCCSMLCRTLPASAQTFELALEPFSRRATNRGSQELRLILKAPTPSIDNTVNCRFNSVATRMACPTQSVPARVDNANCNGAQTASTSSLNCHARTFATSQRKTVPVAMPRTPPSFFCSVVMVASIKMRHTTLGTCPLAKSCAASNTRNNVFWSSKQTQSISLVHLPGPAATPEGEPRRQSWKIFLSEFNGRSGLKSVSQLGKGFRVLGGQWGTNIFVAFLRNMPSFDTALGGLPTANHIFLFGVLRPVPFFFQTEMD